MLADAEEMQQSGISSGRDPRSERTLSGFGLRAGDTGTMGRPMTGTLTEYQE
jgi:hypothetical protein